MKETFRWTKAQGLIRWGLFALLFLGAHLGSGCQLCSSGTMCCFQGFKVCGGPKEEKGPEKEPEDLEVKHLLKRGDAPPGHLRY